MKQTYVTALLLWLMLAGVCRGQGHNRFGVITTVQTKWNGYPFPLWRLGIGTGVSYRLQLNKKISLKTATIAMLQNEHVTCNDTVVLVYPTSISNGDTILACTDANEKRLWQLQIPVMAHYSPNPLARVPLVIGAGVQANVLLSSIDQQKNYFNHKPLHWDISLSIGTCIKLPSNKYLRTEMQFRKPFPIQSFNPFVNTYAFQLGFEF